MFESSRLTNKWIIITLLAGIAVVILIVLSYMDLWRPRKYRSSDAGEKETGWLKMWDSIPWSLKVTYIFLVAWSFIYSVYLLLNPPDW